MVFSCRLPCGRSVFDSCLHEEGHLASNLCQIIPVGRTTVAAQIGSSQKGSTLPGWKDSGE